jgi:hypothetical protein
MDHAVTGKQSDHHIRTVPNLNGIRLSCLLKPLCGSAANHAICDGMRHGSSWTETEKKRTG